MAQQTAVEWLINRYHDYGTLYYEDITKAKEMEKEQREQCYIEGANMAKEIFKEELKDLIVLPKTIFNENNL